MSDVQKAIWLRWETGLNMVIYTLCQILFNGHLNKVFRFFFNFFFFCSIFHVNICHKNVLLVWVIRKPTKMVPVPAKKQYNFIITQNRNSSINFRGFRGKFRTLPEPFWNKPFKSVPSASPSYHAERQACFHSACPFTFFSDQLPLIRFLSTFHMLDTQPDIHFAQRNPAPIAPGYHLPSNPVLVFFAS